MYGDTYCPVKGGVVSMRDEVEPSLPYSRLIRRARKRPQTCQSDPKFEKNKNFTSVLINCAKLNPILYVDD